MTQTHDGFMGFMTQTSRGGEVRTQARPRSRYVAVRTSTRTAAALGWPWQSTVVNGGNMSTDAQIVAEVCPHRAVPAVAP
jgi:hypothetical protein